MTVEFFFSYNYFICFALATGIYGTPIYFKSWRITKIHQYSVGNGAEIMNIHQEINKVYVEMFINVSDQTIYTRHVSFFLGYYTPESGLCLDSLIADTTNKKQVRIEIRKEIKNKQNVQNKSSRGHANNSYFDKIPIVIRVSMYT